MAVVPAECSIVCQSEAVWWWRDAEGTWYSDAVVRGEARRNGASSGREVNCVFLAVQCAIGKKVGKHSHSGGDTRSQSHWQPCPFRQAREAHEGQVVLLQSPLPRRQEGTDFLNFAHRDLCVRLTSVL